MESSSDIQKIITEAKNICLIPLENEPESLSAALALFYTLKDSGKNVNLMVDRFPDKLQFLLPPPDFISQPKSFVIAIPRSIANVSQIYYEKTDENLKIHLTVDNGQIKKENLSFYFQEAKPDLIITSGIQNFQKYLQTNLDSAGFLLDAPILNVDNNLANEKFGQINLVEQKSLSEMTMEIIRLIPQKTDIFNAQPATLNKNSAQCLLTGLIIYYEDFRSRATSHETFSMAADLINLGAAHQQIIDNLYKTTQQEVIFFTSIFQNLKNENSFSVATLDSKDFENFGEPEAKSATEKIKSIGIQGDMLVLWRGHSSAPSIKGFLYSKKENLLNVVAYQHQGVMKNGWVFLSIPGEDINLVKEKISTIII